MIEERLKRWSTEKGRTFAVSGLDVLETARLGLEARRDDGLIDAGFYRDNLGGFGYPGDAGVEGAEAVLIVSVPSPAHVVTFEREAGPVRAVLPPTYVRYRAIFEDVKGEIEAALGGGVRIGILKAPLKSLSVCTGLAAYGRNNLTYVEGSGSYHQLCGYVVGGEAGRRLKTALGRTMPAAIETSLARCRSCRACITACPAGAIREDRFLISAEKCVTLYSERRGPFPAGIRGAASSSCLVGCLECQEICPENKGRLRYELTDVTFTAAETGALIELGRREAVGENPAWPDTGLWPGIAGKFERFGCSEDAGMFARNLAIRLRPVRG
jgi:epoxyqueuosine reductase